jgi:hypothetical protein
MPDSKPIRQSGGCDIVRTQQFLRARIGSGLANEVQECYRALAGACLQGGCRRVLVLGSTTIDPFYHLALRDALRSIALAGVPDDFRLAVVALTPGLIAIYDASVVEAQRLGLEARRFMNEQDAEAWLMT